MESQNKSRTRVNGGGGGGGGERGRGGVLDGFSPVSSTRIDWKSRKRTGKGRDVEKVTTTREEDNVDINEESFPSNEVKMEDAADATTPVLSERRKALFEPLEPTTHANRRRPSAESLLPMPDFDTATYPRGWQIGKKRKLVNVDVVESMRRIAVQEMNRQDKEIDDLNGVVEEDGWLIEHLQTQLQDERNKRSDVERENAMLRDQINMLMNMLQDGDAPDDESPHVEP